MKNELELKGRRLIVMKQVAKDDVSKLKQDNSHIDKSADKRNLAMRKEGLLNEKDWIHKEPALIGKDLEQR